jgi:Tfp pilus assembly protein PilV
MRCARRLARAFALYEVLLGMAIFSVGVLALGRSVENCLRASALNSEQARVRQILANRMSEIQASSALPDTTKETRIDTGYGEVKLIQRSAPANLQDDQGLEMSGIIHVALSVEWTRGRITQSKKLEFYVYRNG